MPMKDTERMEEELPIFSFAIASELVLLRQRRGQQVSVLVSQWDHQLDRFLPPRNWPLQVPGNLELLAADIVADYETGELQPYLVLGSSSTLVVGVLNISEDNFEIAAEIPITSDFSDDGSCAKLECIITNGPTIIASLWAKLLVVYPQNAGSFKQGDQYDSHKHCDIYEENLWVAYIVNLNDICMGCNFRILFAHDWRTTCTPEVVLGTSNICMDSMSPEQLNHSLQRSQGGGSFICLDLHSLGRHLSDITQNCSVDLVKQSWVKVYEKSASLLCNELFPAELNTLSISCTKLVYSDPSSLASSMLTGDRRCSESFPDIIIGTYNCEILKCRHGKLIADVSIDSVPLLLSFAVVAGGQGVLFATVAGMEGKVIAFCCETLNQLQVWSGITSVVVGDFQLVGHDQVLLVKSPPSCEQVPLSFAEKSLYSMFITDFKRSGFVGLNDQQQELKFTEGFEAARQKNRHIQSVGRFLQMRIEAGKLQVKQLQEQMEKKEQLLKSSCHLMEEMVERPILAFIEEHSLPANKYSKSELKGNGLHLVKIEHLYHGLQAKTWFLVIILRSIVPRGLILDGATLLLTTVQGQITGSTSTVRILNDQDRLHKFVVAIPLRNFTAFACFPVVNIILTAWLSCEHVVQHQSICSTNHEQYPFHQNYESIVDRRHKCLHTEWLGRICIGGDDLIRQFVSKSLSYVVREVGENQLFILRPKAENDLFKLPSEIKSVLHMEYCRKEYDDLQVMKSNTCELVTQTTFPFAQAVIHIFKDAALLTLSTEDLELLSCMAAFLRSHFQHQYDICLSASCEDMLDSIFLFTGAFFQELALKNDSHHAEMEQSQYVPTLLRNLELLTDQACIRLVP